MGYLDDLVTSNSTNFTDPKAVSAHYLATKVYDFYKENIVVTALIIMDKK